MPCRLSVTLATILLSWSLPAMTAEPQSRSGTFHLDATPTRLLPLFTAAGERAWAPGWEPEMLSGDVARGSVFRTRAHGHTTVWIVTDYDAHAGRVSYARQVESLNMGLVDVALTPDGAGTRVEVRYTLTPLSDEGAKAAAEFLAPEHYAAFVREWRDAIAPLLDAKPSG
jgi:hypothetical protein